MGECEAGIYTTNIAILRGALPCWGFDIQPPCKHVRACLEEHKAAFSKRKFNALLKKVDRYTEGATRGE